MLPPSPVTLLMFTPQFIRFQLQASCRRGRVSNIMWPYLGAGLILSPTLRPLKQMERSESGRETAESEAAMRVADCEHMVSASACWALSP